MKTLSALLEEHYISSLDELETLLEKKDNSGQILDIPDNENNVDLKQLTRIVLIGEMRYASIREQEGITLDYADPTKLEYELDDDIIKVDDGEYKFELKPDDRFNTVVFVRSGYKKPNVAFLLDEIIKMGILVLNNPDNVHISNDKFLTSLLLAKYNIPQPKNTLIVPHDIHKGEHDKFDKKLKTIYGNLDDNHKYVCKLLNGHGGKGVFICRGSNILSVIQCMFAIDSETQVFVQEYIEIKEGDIRAHVITLNGKQVLLDVTMRKKGGHDFRTNLSLGNSQETYELNEEQTKVAFAAAKASGLTWAGVDLLPAENGKTYVLEINGAPGAPSEIESDELKQANKDFYKKFIDTINSLC